MFYYHNIINLMIDTDPMLLRQENFEALRLFQMDQEKMRSIKTAIRLKSFANDFYILAITYHDFRQFKLYEKCWEDHKGHRFKLRRWVRVTKLYEAMIESPSMFQR